MTSRQPDEQIDHPANTRRAFLRRAAMLGATAIGVPSLLAACEAGQRGVASRPRRPSTPPTTPLTSPPVLVATSPAVDPRLATTLPPYFETGPRTRPLVAITLDDVFETSGAQNLRALLDVLYANDLPMTVFPTGSALKQHYDAGLSWIWQAAVATNLVEIGNHTYTHNTGINPDLTKLSDAQIADELNRTQAMLDQVLGFHYPMRLMRPPGGFGRGNARVIAAVNKLGYSLVGWDIGGDSATPGADFESAIINRKATTNGSIVLTHFTTLRLQDYQPLFDDMRLVRHLQPTTVTGLFQTN